MADLKLCPMCGGTADLKRFHVRCTHCRLRTDDYTHNVDAIAAWNARIPASPVPEMEGKFPVVLYFANRSDADEMVAAVEDAFPHRVWRRV